MRRRIGALVLALCLLLGGLPMAEARQDREAVSQNALVECRALGLWKEEYAGRLEKPLGGRDLRELRGAVGRKLAQLGLSLRREPAPALRMGASRRGVMNALWMELAAREVPGMPRSPRGAMVWLGLGGLLREPDRICSLAEALDMAQQVILAVYDRQGAGSKGLLWKASGNGNTLYLLGTIHLDQGDVYPLHSTLRQAVDQCETAALEVDFGDEADLARYQMLQLYTDGTSLADHISPLLYQEVSRIFLGLGLTRKQIDRYRPWVLAGALTQLAAGSGGAGETPLAPDIYVQEKARANGAAVTAVESMTYQAEYIFNDLSDAYLEAYLATGLAVYQGGEAPAEEAARDQEQRLAAMAEAWKKGDPAALAAAYDKEAILADTADELSVRLFTQRDPNMIAWADSYLKQPGRHTGILAVGAGHMIGSAGIVQGLKDLGYTVETVYGK